MISIILKRPWEVWSPAIDVGFDFDRSQCPFCSLNQIARTKPDAPRRGPYETAHPDDLDVQEDLENPDKHDKDCLWRLAKEYRT
jgi:hypothetical protein